MDVVVDGWMLLLMDGWMLLLMDGWMDGWMDVVDMMVWWII